MAPNVFRFLWKYLSKLKFLFFSVLISILLGEACVRIALYYGSHIVETLSLSLPKQELWHQALNLTLLTSLFLFLKGFFTNVVIFIEAHFLPKYYTYLARDLFAYAHQHSTAFFAEEMAGNISGKITTILNNSYHIYYNLLWGFMSPLIALVISFAFIFNVNSELGLLMLGLNISLIALIYKLSKKLVPFAEKEAHLNSQANGELVDSIANAVLVKSFSNYSRERKRYFTFVRKAAQADKEETIQFGKIFLAQGFFRSLLEITFYALPLWYWYQDQMSIGEFVLVQSLIMTLSSFYNSLSMQFMQFFRLYGGIDDGLKLLMRPLEVCDKPQAQILKQVGDISISNIKYHYKRAYPLFENFNLDIKQGEKIGLVGRSGSGKSTLIKLLVRLYDVQEGKITINQTDITDVSQDSLRRQIALIPQEASLFNRSIMDNIRYGNFQASDDEVIEAAKKAYCHEFISQLPQGYQSKVGEHGVMLSGGERQRIAMARAILKNAPILILDEATSALDSESERYIQDSLHQIMQDKTVIAIAHRLSTLREMDRIVVMEKGKIIEEGTHEELVKQSGAYHSFYELQSSGFIKMQK